MRKSFGAGRRVAIFVLVAVVSLLLLNNFYKRPWQIEAETLVQKTFPVGMTRTRMEKIEPDVPCYFRDEDDGSIGVIVMASQMQNKPSWLYDAVGVAVYLDSAGNVESYSGAYGVRVTWP